jgi:hypothetical protein
LQNLFAEVSGEVHGELLNLGVVVLLDLLEQLDVAAGHEVDRNTLAAVAAAATDAVQVVLLVAGEIEVDHDVDVVNIDTAGNEVGGDEHTGAAGAEGGHDLLALTLGHLGVHRRHGVVVGVELLGDPVDLAARVGEDDGLGNGDGLVQVHQGVQLVLLLDGDEELLDTLERQVVTLDEDTGGVTHELLGELEDVFGHGGREERDLDVLWQELEDLVNLVRETLGEHLIGLIKDQDAEAVSAEGTALDHVGNAAGGADGDDDASLQLLQVLLHAGSTNEGVREALKVAHVLTDLGDDGVGLLSQLSRGRQDQGLEVTVTEVNALQKANREGTGLAGTRLRLGDDVATADERGDGTLLDGGGLLKTVRVDTAEKVLMKGHVVEGRDDAHLGRVVVEGLVVLGLWLVSRHGFGWLFILIQRVVGKQCLCRIFEKPWSVVRRKKRRREGTKIITGLRSEASPAQQKIILQALIWDLTVKLLTT